MSVSLLSKISRYFKFLDWMVERNRLKEKSVFHNDENIVLVKSSDELSTKDIDLATHVNSQFVEGLNTDLAQRIVKYRSKLEGFFEIQICEVFNIPAPLVQIFFKIFKIGQKPRIKKRNVNTIGFR